MLQIPIPLRFSFFLLFLLFLFASGHSFPWHNPHWQQQPSKVRVAYWPSYSAGTYPAAKINARLFTHLNFAFVLLNSSSNTVGAADLDSQAQLRTFSATVKSQNPAVKTLISIGGGGSDFNAFAAMASNASSRSTFIKSSIALARSNHFDGLDLDWEFPQSQTDMDNLGTLFAEWRAACDAEAKYSRLPRLLLTAAVYYSGTLRFVGDGTYPTKSINENLDWVGLMAFDYHGSWEPTVTGAHTALYDPNSTINTNAGVSRWFEAGLKPGKAVLGLAMYGHSWILKDPNSKAGIGAPAVGPGPGDATPVFSAIMEMVAANKSSTVVFDGTTVTAYAQIGSLWVGFDNEVSVCKKVLFLRSRGMRGYFFWTASFDSASWTLSRTAAAALGF